MALAVALTATLGAATLPGGNAKADPAQYNAFVGVGSDTVQDVMNALSGSSFATAYTPIKSTSGQQIISFDATIPAGVADNCITAKLNGPTFTRPVGSGAGRKALYAASGLSTAGWTGGTNGICASAVDISGQLDFARSSSGPSSGDTSTNQTYIPFGRDAVSFAYYRAAGSPVTSLTRQQLQQLFNSGPQTILGVRIVPCGMQESSGTHSFWVKTAMGIGDFVGSGTSSAIETAATAECNALLGRSEENDGTALKARGDALAAVVGKSNDQVVIGFSAASFVARSNGKAANPPPSGVGIGTISDNGSGVPLGSPVSGTAPTLVPSSTFYASSIFGRNVYVVIPNTVATGAGNAQIKSLFVSTTNTANDAKICLETGTIQAFGFLPVASCGSTALKGAWTTGATG